MSASDDFLDANANVEYMAHVLADCLRHSMRATIANDQTAGGYRASEEFKALLDLMVRSKGLRLYDLFDRAIAKLRLGQADLRERSAYQKYEDAIVAAAQAGLGLLIESSCADNAAAGRASKRQRSFLDSIKYIEVARQEMISESNDLVARTRASKSALVKRERQKKPGPCGPG
jgi:hypothetical protein